jgi:hypothetical protein
VQGEADGVGDHGTRPYEHRRPPGSCGRHQVTGRLHLVIIDEQGTHRVLGREEPIDSELPLDHEHRLVGVQPDSAGRVVEVTVKVESRIIGVAHFEKRARGDDMGVLGRVRHPASLAYPM